MPLLHYCHVHCDQADPSLPAMVDCRIASSVIVAGCCLYFVYYVAHEILMEDGGCVGAMETMDCAFWKCNGTNNGGISCRRSREFACWFLSSKLFVEFCCGVVVVDVDALVFSCVCALVAQYCITRLNTRPLYCNLLHVRCTANNI